MAHPLLLAALAIPAAAIVVLGGMIVLGTAPPPPPLGTVYSAVAAMPKTGLPALERYRARDGSQLAFRRYDGSNPNKVAILIHGSTGEGSNMHLMAEALIGTGTTVYTLDIRGHGQSGRRGDIDYRGQLEDDLVDFVTGVTPPRPGRQLTLVGFSAGGGFALRFAASPHGELFDRYILLAPYLGQRAPTLQPATGGWTALYRPRIYAIGFLDAIGIDWFNGLPIVAFARRPDPAEPVPTYSYRLARDFGPDLDFASDFTSARRPITIIAGSADDQMIADRYAPTLAAIRPDIPVEIVPGVGHLGITMDPAALAAIRDVLDQPAAKAA